MPRKRTKVTANGTDPLAGSVTIGFRLSQESRQLLVERAARLEVSEHQLARDYVTEMLHGRESQEALVELVCRLHQEIVELRKDIKVMGEALLTSAGKVTDQDAREWVQANLTSSPLISISSSKHREAEHSH
jgi:hypothetical protein